VNPILVRQIAVLQANLTLLESERDTLTELGDMQAHRFLQDEIAEFIASHAQRGNVPPNPLAHVLEDIDRIEKGLRETERFVIQTLKTGEKLFHKASGTLSLALLEEFAANIPQLRSTLPQRQAELAAAFAPTDWQEASTGKDVPPELLTVAAILRPQTLLAPGNKNAKRRQNLYQFTQGAGRLHWKVLRHLAKIENRCRQLFQEYATQKDSLAKAMAIAERGDYRTAASLLSMRRIFEDLPYAEVEKRNATWESQLQAWRNAFQEFESSVHAEASRAKLLSPLALWESKDLRDRVIQRVARLRQSLEKSRATLSSGGRSEFEEDARALLDQIASQLDRLESALLARLNSSVKSRSLNSFSVVVGVGLLAVVPGLLFLRAPLEAIVADVALALSLIFAGLFRFAPKR
jgi:hypothetical protein